MKLSSPILLKSLDIELNLFLVMCRTWVGAFLGTGLFHDALWFQYPIRRLMTCFIPCLGH